MHKEGLKCANACLRVGNVWNCKCTLCLRNEICMKRVRSTAFCTVFFLVMVGASFAKHVQTDFDHQANVSQYKTYSWQEIKPPNSLWDARIKDAVDAQLAAKGWTQVDSDGNVAIVAIKTTQTQRTLQTFYDGFGGGWGWRRFGAGGFGDSTTTEQDYKDGTLVVDLYDARTKQLIWRGSAEDTLSDKAEKNERNLDKGVAKMFKAFPPGAAKG
jgi:Domain of unknown function (DUF4136)